jgi:hypothetical protein
MLPCIKQKFQIITKAKINEGILLGHEIRKITRNSFLVKILSGLESAAWRILNAENKNFPRNLKVEYCESLVKELTNVYNYTYMRCNTSLKFLSFTHTSAFCQHTWALLAMRIYNAASRNIIDGETVLGQLEPRTLADHGSALIMDAMQVKYKRKLFNIYFRFTQNLWATEKF